MKIIFVTIIIIGCIITLSFTKFEPNHRNIGVAKTLEYFKRQATVFAKTTMNLEQQIRRIEKNNPTSIAKAREALKKSRLQYKTIEFFLSYFLNSSSLLYNQPNKIEVEEPFLEYHEPTGFQVMESMLFDKDVAGNKKELLQQISLIHSSASDLNALLYNLEINDKQILESIRLELIRVITLGITGFDAPELKTGITESYQALATINTILSYFLLEKDRESDSVASYLNAGLRLLAKKTDFDSFDRLGFLTDAALPLQQHLGLFIKQSGLELNTTGALNYNAKNLFSADGIDIRGTSVKTPALVSLGQTLFFEKGLSGNSTRSCATCHQPEKYFTDQLVKSLTLDGLKTVERNAPSLFYSTYQYSQFWDGRAKSLEEQINTVLLNPVEMGADHKVIIQRLTGSPRYVEAFKNAFPGKADTSISIHHISLSLTAFLGTLAPFSSSFDKYINGDKSELSKEEMKGFNLFMGKAQCGTCHFAPLFNGLIPPLYQRTELEVLGVTKSSDFNRPEQDPDSGRYKSFPIIYYVGAFKTPTIRDAGKTAPYMHNGAFPSLEKVLDFYNKGGALGLGLKMPTQTLSPKPLKLNSSEIKQIISFLNSLTDTYQKYN